jgi:hypothetical protein
MVAEGRPKFSRKHAGCPQFSCQDALAIAAALESQSKAISNLSMHSQRLSRQFERKRWELDNLLDIIEMYKSKGEPFDPSAIGLVFSESQINESILARTRQRLVREACKYRH